MKKKRIILGLSLLCAGFALSSCVMSEKSNASNSKTSLPTEVSSSGVNEASTSGETPSQSSATPSQSNQSTSADNTSINSTTGMATQSIPTSTTNNQPQATSTTNQATPTTSTSSQTAPTTSASSQTTPTTSSSSNQTTPTTSTTNQPVTPTSTSTYTQSSDTSVINILKSGGDQECVYAEFTGVSSASSYNVYVKSSTDSNYTKIDQQLVRKYSSGIEYYRFDAVGIKSGTYSFKIVPVSNGNEDSAKAVTKDNISVVSYDRTGFAFSNLAGHNGEAPGAYKNDGTLKSNAHVIYLTETNKSTVKATVAGTEYTGIVNITQAIKTKNTTEPYAIRVIGKLNYEGTVCSDMSKWYAMGCKDASNITVEGIGNDAVMYGGGVGFNKCKSIEVRNLGFIEWGKGNSDSDAVQFQGSEHVWVHDNDIFYGHKASGDQAKGDGSVDLKDDTKYMTVSYNHFWDSGKMSLCGMKSESGENYISYHHNWFDHSDSRHPRIRTMTVHVYNNYYDGVSKYGVGAVLSAQCFAEGNYFRNCKDPFLVGGYGTDGKASKSTFSGETKGFIKAYNNHIEGATSLLYANVGTGVAGSTGAGTKDNSDAYLASSRDEVISNEYTNGVAYSNFDTKVDLGVTASEVESPEDAKTTVMQYSGRVTGGDISYSFNNSTADTSYDIDNTLSALLIAYTSKMVSVQGIEGSSSVTPAPTPTPTETTGAEVNALIEALPAASAVTASDRSAIDAAKSAYDSLSTKEKANVTSDNVTKLNACVSALQSLPQSAETLTFSSGSSGDNSFFTVSGNLKSGVDSKTYNGTTYTSALKMESSTRITFTTTQTTTITIVTDTASKKIKINDKNYTTDSNGVVVIDNFAAGAVTIVKGDSMNVYTIIVE